MKKKLLKYILICISVYVTLILIEFCSIYAALGDNIWNYLKDCWNWYKTLF